MSRPDIGLRTRVSCPFNPAHVMNYSKFHNHFVKCRKQHPDDKRKSCPYNFSELIEPDQMEKHLTVCEYRFDYGSSKVVEDYTPIEAPYNISFGDDEWHRRTLMNNDDVDPDEDIDSVSVYDEDFQCRRYPETDTESRSHSLTSKFESLGRGEESFFGNGRRSDLNRESESESHSNPVEVGNNEGFSFLREENIRPKKKEAVEFSRCETTSSLESSDDVRMAFLRKLRADAVNEPEQEAPKKGRGRAAIFNRYYRRT